MLTRILEKTVPEKHFELQITIHSNHFSFSDRDVTKTRNGEWGMGLSRFFRHSEG